MSTRVAGAGVDLLQSWDADALETGDIRPKGSAAAVLLWDEPTQVDGGPSERLAATLALVLAGFGEIAFRWNGQPPAGTRTLARLRSGWFRTRSIWTVVATADPECAAGLFDNGWSSGDQAALIGFTDERAAHLLSLDNLSDTRLLAEELMFAAVVDGAGGLVAAGSERRLADIVAAAKRDLLAAGFAFNEDAGRR